MSLLARILAAGSAFALTCLPSHARHAMVDAVIPDFLRLQSGGSQGLLSAGAGKSFAEGLIESELSYGYVPEWVGGTGIHVLTHRTTLSPFPLELGRAGTWRPAILGYSVHIGLGERYFLFSRKFDHYYWPSALHFRAFTGTRFGWRTGRIPGISYVTGILEIGALDSYLIDAYNNRSIGLRDIVSAALAVQLSLGPPAQATPAVRREN